MKLRAVALPAVIAVLGLAGPGRAGAAVVPRCQTVQLRVSFAPISGGLEHAGGVVGFRNRSSSRCALGGYPGVAGLSASGATVFNARRTLAGYLGGPRRTRTVVLAPGANASALLEWLDIPAPGQKCARIRQLGVTPPGDRQSIGLPVAGRLCGPTIHPVVAGRRGGAGA